MTAASRTFRVFVSSTFSDLKAERDLLQEHIYPRLRDLCAQHGCRFQAIDLRWGVSEEAALDQQTINICLEELRRCQHTSPRPNFIVLLGQRYGWCPPPPQIDAAELEELLGAVESVEDRVLLYCPEPPASPQPGMHWYRRDDNAVPSEYALRPRESLVPDGASKEERGRIREEEAEGWRHLESRMRRILLNAAERLGWLVDDPRRAKYERSATHQEIEAGAFSPDVERPEDHVFCFLREVADLPRDSSAAAFIDLNEHGQLDPISADRLHQLKTKLKNRLREKTPQDEGNVHIYRATWTGIGPTTDHLQTLGEDVYRSLSRVILKEVAPVDGPAGDDSENRAHETFGNQRIDVFEGRDDLLEQIRAYIDGADPHPLVLHGVSGCGKTALIAKAAADAAKSAAADAERTTVCRFIGATPASTSLRSLLDDLCRQIDPTDGVLPSEIRELAQELSRRLEKVPAEQPVAVFLDALDQLGDADGARSLWWLPTTLPANVRLIVSVLDAEGSPGDCSRAVGGRVPTRSLVAVGPLAAADGDRILAQWLRGVRRRLQPEQRADVMAKFSAPGNGLPLYLKLAFEEARRWKSFDGLPHGADAEPGLGADVQRVLKDLLGRLTRDENHGPVFTERALGYLAAGRQGLTEDELIDVLSEDAEVLRDFEARSPSSPTVSRLPFIIWSRLRAEVEPYLTERQADNTTVLNFYHRQVRDAVEEWCLGGDKGIRAHRALASYFHGQDYFLESIEQQRLRAKRSPPTPRPANVRKVDELLWQRLLGHQTDDAATLLTDLSFLEAKTEGDLALDLATDFRAAIDWLEATTDSAARSLAHVLRLVHSALRRDLQFIARHPTALFQSLWNSCWWYDSPHASEHFASVDGPWNKPGPKVSDLLTRWRAEKAESTPGFVWVRSMRPPAHDMGTPELALLRNATYGDFWSVAVTPDGRRVIAGSSDHTVQVWDLTSGARLAVLAGHLDRVSVVVVAPDGRRLFSGSQDQTIRVWDLVGFVEVAVLRGHTGPTDCVALSPDGSRLVSSGSDQIRLWDLDRLEEIRVPTGFAHGLGHVAFMPDGRRIVGGCEDGTVRVVDLDLSAEVNVLRGHSTGRGGITAIVVAPDGRVVSSSRDGTVRVWDATATGGRELMVLGGCSNEWEMLDVAVSPDGRRIAAANEWAVRVWDASTGRELAQLIGHQACVYCVAFTPDSRQVVSGAHDRTMRVWSASAEGKSAVPVDHDLDLFNVTVSPDGSRVVTVGRDSIVRVWDARTGVLIVGLQTAPRENLKSVGVTADGLWVVSEAWNGTVRIWSAQTWTALASRDGYEWSAHTMAVTPDASRIIGGHSDGSVRMWDAKTGALVGTARGHQGAVCGVAVTPDGRRIVSGGKDATVRVWDIDGMVDLAVLRSKYAQAIWSVAVTPDGQRIIGGGMDGGAVSWDAGSGEWLGIVSDSCVTAAAVAASFPWSPFRWSPSDAPYGPSIRLRATGQTLAYFPLELKIVPCSDRTWAGANGNHLYLLTLEGDVGESAVQDSG